MNLRFGAAWTLWVLDRTLFYGSGEVLALTMIPCLLG
jgi:hypothetical protein